MGLSFETIEKDEAPVSIGIIQGSIDTRLNAKAEVQAEKFEQYTKLTWEARKQWPDLDVVLWPENGLPVGVYDLVMENRDAERIEWLNESRSKLKEFSRIATGAGLEFSSSVTMIVGGLSIDDQDNYYNSALLIDPSGRVGNRYYKTHRVMYGEYYPILNQIPGIKERLPEISRGTQPASFEVRNKKFAPLICFETTVPHLARNFINRLDDEKSHPVSAIINLTNDGCFLAAVVSIFTWRAMCFEPSN